MNKKVIVFAAVAAGVLSLGSCKGGKSEATGDCGKTAEVAADRSAGTSGLSGTTGTSGAEASEELSEATSEQAGADEGYPSTYEQPEGKVLELLKDYNTRMDDYNTKGVTALGMGFQRNRVLLNYSVDNYLYDLDDRVKLKLQARELLLALKMSERAAWRCIPEGGHTLMMTFVGKESGKIVSVVFTPEELRELL